MDIPTPLEIMVLPGSAGFFINQVAALIQLFRANTSRPHVVAATSGGNITAYLAHAGEWTESGMRRVLGAMDPRLFATPWYDTLFLRWVPTVLWGPLKGSFFAADAQGRPEAFFESLVDPSRFQDVEIWTGTVNRSQFKTQLFCNRTRETSILARARYVASDNMAMLPPIYLDGNVSDVARVTLASASIPTLVPPVEFRGEKYVDGGNAFASPLFPLQDRIREVIGEQGNLHLIRINGYDPDNFDYGEKTTDGVFKVGMNSIAYTQSSLNIHDRQAALALTRMGGRPFEMREGIVTVDTLSDLLAQRKHMDRSLLEIYPRITNEVDIIRFSTNELQSCLGKALAPDALAYRFWYTPGRLAAV